MHSRGSTALAKAACESRPGHLWSIAWCFWVMHECYFHVHTEKLISVDVWVRPLFPDLATYTVSQ